MIIQEFDLRMLELELISDVDVPVACVLELFDEPIGLLLRHTVCFESPALHDLEDLGQELARSNEELAHIEPTARESISLEDL